MEDETCENNIPVEETNVLPNETTSPDAIYEIHIHSKYEISLNDIQLSKEIGTGNFGKVYEARVDGVVVAVKTILGLSSFILINCSS